ncbi:MAG: U32 family peptidase [Clostridia bacterium]|nr:U32 family peptidase [Clostridia bacterium]
MADIELLAPAGSMEAAVAAVRSGANAIYMGFGNFNARRNAKNFSKEEMAEICTYCRARNVKTNITVNTLLHDREFSSLQETISDLCEISPDAIIVADLGVARAFREMAPHLPLHASTQLTVHNADGARAAKKLGFSRVVLSRELDACAIEEITRSVDIETEVFVHGALCMCYSGQCYMSGFIGRRSGNRGLCAQPCRLPYKVNGAKNDTYPLSLKDLCLTHHLAKLREMGVSSLKIEGRMKRPEYVATVCSIYSSLLRENRTPTKSEAETLRKIFSRDGFTDGYFSRNHGKNMFGTKSDDLPPNDPIYKEAQKLYAKEVPLVPIDLAFTAKLGEASSLTATDKNGHSVTLYGTVAEPAINRPLDLSTVFTSLSKTGGTQFSVESADISIDNNVSLPLSSINSLRREVMEELDRVLGKAETVPAGVLRSVEHGKNEKKSLAISVSLFKLNQLTDELKSLPIERIYIPVHELRKGNLPRNIGISLPQIIWDDEWDKIKDKLSLAKEMGIKNVLCSNISQIAPLIEMGFIPEGDMGLNVLNSYSLSEYAKLGIEHATLSPELMLSQVRDIEKCIPCEIIAYGRLPLMVTENCAVASCGKCPGDGVHTLSDRRGFDLPVLCLPNHRNMILNPDVLYLADKYNDLEVIGINRLRLFFTLESEDEVVRICKEYLNRDGIPPQKFTRGLYFRGVE